MLLFFFTVSPVRGMEWVLLFPLVFALVMLLGWIAELRALPKLDVQPRSAPEPEFRVLARPTLRRKPIGGWVVREFVSIPVFVIALWYVPHEFERWSRSSGKTFALLAYAYLAYVVVAHVVEVVRLGREWLAEARLVRRAEATMGRVVDQVPNEQVPNGITYDFRDGFNTLRRGKGKDYSDQLFEGMQVAVLYDPDDPTWNLPACGLNFHFLAADAPSVTTV